MRSADFWSLPLRRPRIGLALGSGAARGWAHVGVIQALEEEGIAIDVVSGTSAGAFIGAFYAADEIEGLLKFSEQALGSPVTRKAYWNTARSVNGAS